MSQVAQLLFVLAGVAIGLVILVALVASAAGDIGDLWRTLGWLGVAVFLAFPTLIAVGAWRSRHML